jgi:hypothetical protein
MKKLALFLLVAVAATALADKTFTYQSAPAVVLSMTFLPRTNGNVFATVCGSTVATAGAPPLPCKDIELPAANPIAVEVQALANGDALTFWKTQNGL